MSGMTWTQLVLTLPGGFRLELFSVHKPLVGARPPLPPAPAIDTTGTPVSASVVSLADYRRAS